MSKENGLKAVQNFLDSFNAQDHKRHSKSLNYPHVRLANDVFRTLESPEQFERQCRNNEPNLYAEGWHHSEIDSIETIHANQQKVHLAITMNRCNKEGKVYKSFETFWIATLVNDHWGIQFRSSYLK